MSYKGKVYDVTNSRLWKNGKHVNRHEAGMDLTEAMEAAPHGMDVLERFEHVDTIEGFRVKQERGRKAVIKKTLPHVSSAPYAYPLSYGGASGGVYRYNAAPIPLYEEGFF